MAAARSPAWEVATECRDAKYLTAAGSCEYLCPEGTYPAGSGMDAKIVGLRQGNILIEHGNVERHFVSGQKMMRNCWGKGCSWAVTNR